MGSPSSSFRRAVLAGLIVSGAAVAGERAARACGCFTPPDPSVPVVQAGERILFSIENGKVTAHIQIQYAGSAGEFGWLLPLPSVPTMKLGTDELFTALTGTTQPKYRLVRQYEGNCTFNPANFRGGVPGAVGSPTAGGSNDSGSGPVVVAQGSVGPFDYAVLKAETKQEMLDWLAQNRYFVPAGTDETVGRYLHAGAYFLALKLRPGQSTGDLQPVIVEYDAERAMIPIVLTSVAAQPNMGIQVWMLGEGRAIPHNYYHTVINDLAIDWQNAGQNYNDVITAAVGQAPGKHSFVTEYAGPSAVMKNVLLPQGRFGTMAELAASSDAFAFIRYLRTHSYPFTSQLIAILERGLGAVPAQLASMKVTPEQFFVSADYYRAQYPSAFAGWPAQYQPQELASEIEQRIVEPTTEASALFDRFPYLTRLYTTLSPEDMNKDPTFGFNKSLPDIANVHEATLTYFCGALSNDPATTPARLVTEQGWVREFPAGTGSAGIQAASLNLAVRRLEELSEEGPPRIVADNPPPNGCGCAVSGESGGTVATAGLLGAAAFGLIAGAATRLRRKRRSRQP